MMFLRDILANGAQPAKAVLAAARDAGIAERTLHRAKKALGAVSGKPQFDAEWLWTMRPKRSD